MSSSKATPAPGSRLLRWLAASTLNPIVGGVSQWLPPRFSGLRNQSFDAPSEQAALDIFAGDWASALPSPYAHLKAGQSPAFEDARIRWGLQQLGDLSGKEVVELGPLEGGHTFMLSRASAKAIVAVESNQAAFLKCLIVKELLGIANTRFLLGDCVSYLESCGRRFDLCVASGILYHMGNPAQLIERIARVSDHMLLWTHYYHASMKDKSTFRSYDHVGRDAEYRGFRHRLHRQMYGRSLFGKSFWGGTQAYSNWMEREDILGCLRYFGFRHIEVGPENTNGPSAPSFTLVARK